MQPEDGFVEFARTEVESSVARRFENIAARFPERLAIKSLAQQLTYRAFNRQANRIAWLIRRRAAEGRAVALLLDHGVPAILAIFAVLKAGRCFVPLDAALPAARLKYMLEDSGAALILTNGARLALARQLMDQSRIVDLDGVDGAESGDNLGLAIAPGDLSCILYTSGTTGKPKGLMHTQRNELHNIMHHTNTLRLCAGDRLTLLGSYSTGQGMQDLYSALLNGATLYPWSLKADGLTGLANWLHSEKITVYHSAASVFRYLVRTLTGAERFPDLRVVRLGSEPVSWKDVAACRQYFSPSTVLVNALSSSETKTIRQYIVDRHTNVDGLVPVGYGVADTEVMILDEQGQETAAGTMGEIAVASKYIFTGYWRNPQLTAAVMITHPRHGAQRMFRTGEWGRMAADGCLEHLGRKDGQVKVRGYRVETHETEIALLRHDAVESALALCRDNFRGDKFLAAYLTSRGPAPTVSELRAFLQDKLPDYMIPSAFVFLPALPLTPNGKVDVNALPVPTHARPLLDVPFVPASGPMEETLVQLSREVLGLDDVGLHDNHFDLGGSSLTAMQLLARVKASFQVTVELRQFFAQPTLANLQRQIAERLGSALPQPSLPAAPAPRPELLPLSSAQERLWFLDRWEPGNAVYNICRVYDLRGPLDVAALHDSLNGLIARHEVLRSCFPAVDGQARQAIEPHYEISLPVIDLRDLAENDREARAECLAQEQARQSFDLAQLPLLRVKLLRLGGERWRFILTVHQIVSDGWSMQLFYRELWQGYRARRQSKLPALNPLLWQYADFALWQRQRLDGGALEPLLAFWRAQLAGELPVLNLPADRPRPARPSFRGARLPIDLDASLSQALKQLAQSQGVTLFAALMAGFKTLLHRYSGQEDLIVGFPIANRNWTETIGVMGFFVNTLVLRTAVKPAMSFRDLLKNVSAGCLAAYGHQDLPFEKLVEALLPPRHAGLNPIFQAMLVWQVVDREAAGGAGLLSAAMEVDAGTSKFDLTLSLGEHGKGFRGFIEYSTDLFDAATVARMAEHFKILLAGAVADSERPLGELPLLSECERQSLARWNDTAEQFSHELCIHQWFEAQAARRPDAIALVCGDRQISYGELDARANRLANYLRRMGVGQERLVGIGLERSIEMVVGLLAILKAGGAYVPLDPSYPKQRLAFMLADAGVSLIVTGEKLCGHWPGIGNGREIALLCVDRDWPEIDRAATDAPPTPVRPAELAYVIYTSGSTGQPKGVQVTHGSVVNCLESIARRTGFDGQDILLAVTTIAFDIAGLELYMPLALGAKVVIAKEDEVGDGRRWRDNLSRHGVTAMQATPVSWKLLLEAGWRGGGDFKILCGGEALPRDLAQRLSACGKLWNLYGPTETTIWSTLHRVDGDGDGGSVPIGRPLANTQIHILDGALQPVPIGVIGELYIGGSGVARGYLHRPELTAERFFADPFTDEAGRRMYRTGDLARHRADGTIEFIGRADNQVKVRGYRIELGEIESSLRQHGAVLDGAVAAWRSEGSNESELVAYVVARPGAPLALDDLRAHLKIKLPDYMVPSLFLTLGQMPLTPNGKIDRKGLPSPQGSRFHGAAQPVAPRNRVEELVAKVWREVLKLDRLGVDDNFFHLGGHSLLATRVVARLSSQLGVDLPLRKIFERPTVAGLAEEVASPPPSTQLGAAAIAPVPRTGLLPLSFSQRRLWFLQKIDRELTAYHIPAAFRIAGVLDGAALERALNLLCQRHEALRTAIVEVAGEPYQEILPQLALPLPWVDLTHLPQAEAERECAGLAASDARAPYDLHQAPLWRAKLVKVAERDHVLILNFHHMIADGASLAVFYRELAALYQAGLTAAAAPLAPQAVGYADYACWQQQWLESPAAAAQLAYWRRQLAELPAPAALPSDRPRGAARNYLGARLARRLPAPLASRLARFNDEQGVTSFMTLLAAFSLLLARVSGQSDLVIGSTIAGRGRAEMENVMGFFINALPLRVDLGACPSFTALLERVRALCVDAYSNQDIPFEKIVEAVNPVRELNRNPLFDILFNVADASDRMLALAGCQIVRFAEGEPGAKLDLLLSAPEVDGSIELAMVYNGDLYSGGRIATLLEQFELILGQVVARPDLALDEISLLCPTAERLLADPRAKLGETWVGTIPELVAGHGRQAPHQTALVQGLESWSYAELDQAAARLAGALWSSGVRPRDVVAIHARRDAALAVALLGILRVGGVFLILDPRYPAARLNECLKIARPKGWLRLGGEGELDAELAGGLDDLDVKCRMTLPSGKSAIAAVLADYQPLSTNVPPAAADPAYIAFTSGSTGEPKGVLCSHGPMTHFFPWQWQAFDLRADDRFALLSGLSYSHLHRDIFTALGRGAALYIPDEHCARAADLLVNWLRQNAITVLHLTPALGQLLGAGGARPLPAVRRLFFGGDVLTAGDVQAAHRLMPQAVIGSFYGATETQRAVGYYEVADDILNTTDWPARPLPLGRGIEDAQLLVLNRRNRLCGVGELGEIYLRSPHLALGYVGDDERSAAMFIANPFTTQSQDRLYRTGELGRYLPDGNVEWAGRSDRRVNIRGFRVELGEIETVLKQHPTVTDAVVLAKDFPLAPAGGHGQKSDKRLVAYVAAIEKGESEIDLLRSFVGAKLPDYMVPAHFMILDRLPLTSSGKLDYAALPAAESLNEPNLHALAPRNRVESELHRIFVEVLGNERIGVEDNFFRLGGHSLLATQVAVRVKNSFGVSVDLRAFLSAPTVAGVALWLSAAIGEPSAEVDSEREEFVL